MQNLEAPPELMLAQMTYTGVDHAVLQAGGAYGAMTEYNAFAQLQYPQKFTAPMHLDEAMAGTPGALAQIGRAAALGVKGLSDTISVPPKLPAFAGSGGSSARLCHPGLSAPTGCRSCHL